jgi:hypothetical protein
MPGRIENPQVTMSLSSHEAHVVHFDHSLGRKTLDRWQYLGYSAFRSSSSPSAGDRVSYGPYAQNVHMLAAIDTCDRPPEALAR